MKILVNLSLVLGLNVMEYVMEVTGVKMVQDFKHNLEKSYNIHRKMVRNVENYIILEHVVVPVKKKNQI